MNEQLKVDIMGAMARGYCADANANKQLDADLIEAMFVEVIKVVDKEKLEWLKSILPEQSHARETENMNVYNYRDGWNNCIEQILKHAKEGTK